MNVSTTKTGEEKYWASLPAYFLFLYILFVLTTAIYAFGIRQWTFASALLAATTILSYPVLYLLPTAFFSLAAAVALKYEVNSRLCRAILFSVTGFWAFLSHTLLLAGAGIYCRYGYHFYSFQITNLFTNRDGLAAMGLRASAVLTFAAGLLALLLFHAAAAFVFARSHRFALKNFSWKKPGKYIAAGALVVCFLLSMATFSFEHFRMSPPALVAADAFPFFFESTASRFYKRLGFREPDRDAVRLKMKEGGTAGLNSYPQAEIRRVEHPKYNIVWMACESFAASMFTDEIMPETRGFARENAVRFDRHYSGGNVTRQGMFSMFYAIPASCWSAFLKVCRGPLLIDWLNEDGYSLECFTSSKFSYPEFDKTIFFKVPSANLHSDDAGLTWERDRRNVVRLMDSIDAGAASGKPFFRFMFFESPHNPYEFPPDAVIRKDYMDPFNEVLAVKANAEKIRARAVNLCHHLDQQLGRVLRHLKEKNLLDTTIVVIAGDHGEEYFEKGYLGHSSAFVEEQIRTPLVLHIPGRAPAVYTHMSSHLDIVPMLAPHLGVVNASRDFSAGYDLLAEHAVPRRYVVSANWQEVFFTGEKYKSQVPLNSVDYAKQTITDANDNPLPSVDPFYREYNADLKELQQDLVRFTGAGSKGFGSWLIWIIVGGIVLATVLADALILILRGKAASKRVS